MSLFIYTRHTADCPKRSDRFSKRCRCPKWIRGMLNDLPFRQSAGTRSWEKAEEKRRLLENEAEARAKSSQRSEIPQEKKEPTTIKAAVARFLSSKKNENLAESTLEKLKTIFENGSLPGQLQPDSAISQNSRPHI